MKLIKSGDWGLRLLAIILAIVIYHALKNKSESSDNHYERSFFQSR